MRPLQPRMSKRRNLAIAAVIWISSSLISCPMLLFFKTEEVRICRLLPGECNNILSLSLSLSFCTFYCPQGASNQAEQLTHRLLLRVARWSDQFLQARIFVSMTERMKGRIEGGTHESSLLHSKLHWAVNQEIRETCSCYRIIIASRNAAYSFGCHKISP